MATLFSAVAVAQTPDAPFQIRTMANLHMGQSWINLTTAGANATICANVYAFSGTGTLLACCGCLVNANAAVSLSVLSDVLHENLPPANTAVIKILGTSAGTCNPSIPLTGGAGLSGLIITGTTLHSTSLSTFTAAEMAFTPITISVTELAKLNACAGLVGGTCNICRTGAN